MSCGTFFLYIVYGRVVLDKLIVAQMVEFSVSYVIPRVVVVLSSRMNPSAGVHGFFKNRFLGAFAKLRKATVSFVMSVRLCVRVEHLGSRWTGFREMPYFIFF
jgi:hypothetical protein